MRATLKKSIVVSLAALTLVAGLSASVTPAAAWPMGNHHGFGGFGLGLGVGLGLGALGGIAASQPGYAYGYDSCIRYRPTYDQWGNYVGRQPVAVC